MLVDLGRNDVGKARARRRAPLRSGGPRHGQRRAHAAGMPGGYGRGRAGAGSGHTLCHALHRPGG